MAVVKGTNSGLVTTRPVSDPAGSNSVLDGKTWAQRVIPDANITVTEIGIWVDTASEEANFEIGIYDHDAVNNRPGNLLAGASQTNAKGTAAGWIYGSVSIELTAGTTYWIACQCDDVTTTTYSNYSSETGERYSIESASTLNDPWGAIPGIADLSLAVYAVYSLTVAYPSAGTAVDTDFASSVTSMAVNMPATVNSGDRLFAFSEVRNAGTWTTIPTGWSQLKQQAGGSSVGELTIFEKIADGTEGGGTATWVADTSTTAAWHVVRVTDAHASTASEVTSSSGDFTTNPDPPSLSPSWGNENNLFIEVAGNAATTNLTTGASTNYSGYALNTASTGGSQCSVSSASRQYAASSEDPGEMTNAGSIRYWAAVTIAVRPVVTGASSIKSVAGVANASLKSIAGVANASIKSIAGVSN